jgi:hypothetical protein
MITPSDVLFAWDAGLGIVPTVGGEPSFSRGGSKWVRTRARGGSPLYTKVVGDQAGFSWVEKDGVLLPRRMLWGEMASTPTNDDSVRFEPSATAWSLTGAGKATDEGARDSVFAPLPSDGEAREFSSSGGSGDDARLRQPIGSSTGGREVVSAVFEQAIGDGTCEVRADDDTGIYLRALYTFATDSVNLNTGEHAYREILAERGPNGGRVVRLVCTGVGNNTTGRTVEATPVTNEANESRIIHHAQHEELPFATSPVVYVGAPATRPADVPVTFDPGPKPQPFALYWRGVPQELPATPNRMVMAQSAGSNPRWELRKDNTGDNAWRIGVWDASGNLVSNVENVAPDPTLIWDFVVVAALEESPPRVRLIIAQDGNVITGEGSTNSAWALPDEWDEPRLSLGSRANLQMEGSLLHGRALMARLAALDAPTDGSDDQALRDELADVPIGPHRAGHA